MDDPEALNRLLSLRERMAKQEAATATVTREFTKAPQLVSLDRRRSITGRKTQITELRSRHQQILRMDIKGISQVEIAECLGISAQMVSIAQNSDVYRAEKSRIQAELTNRAVTDATEASKVKQKILAVSGIAIDKLEEILTDRLSDPKLQTDIAFDILDRAGHKPAQKVEIVSYKDKLQAAYARRMARIKAEQSEKEANENAVEAEYTPIVEVQMTEEQMQLSDDREGEAQPQETPPQ